MTKRQVLNALLDVEEERKKIKASQIRLENRESRYEDKREGLSKQLAAVLKKEQEKEGIDTWHTPDPVLYKNHTFAPTTGSRWSPAKCVITAVKSVK